MKLFMSYAIQDEALADRLATHLQDAGFETWVYTQNIDKDRPYARQITRAIRNADVHLILVTESTSTSLGVSSEVLYSQSRDKPLLPLVSGTEANIPYSLLNYRHVNIEQEDLETSVASIVRALQKYSVATRSDEPDDSDDSEDVSEDELPDVSSAETDIEASIRIFIAYSHKQRPLVKSLSDLLTKHGKRHFWDKRIKAGAAWRRTIQQALDGCTHLIVVWTEGAANSDEVEREVSYALQEGKTIIPLLSKDIPKRPYHLNGFQYVVFDGSMDAIEQDILDAIAGTSHDDIWQ